MILRNIQDVPDYKKMNTQGNQIKDNDFEFDPEN